jgi:hypothetical protein
MDAQDTRREDVGASDARERMFREEALYADTLTCCACGLSVEETLEAVVGATRSLLRMVARDALLQGVEREDIDPSWFGR